MSGTGVTAARIVPGSAPITRAGGQGLALARAFQRAVMLRAAAMLQPAHDGLVLAQHLHAVDAEIEIVLARCRDGPLVTTSGQVISGAGSPGQQVWIGSLREVDLVAASARSPGTGARLTVLGFIAMHGLGQRQQLERLAAAARRLGLAQERQQLADFAQLRGGGALLAAPWSRPWPRA